MPRRVPRRHRYTLHTAERPGRPYSPALHVEAIRTGVINAIRQGVPMAHAADSQGIPPDTFNKWMARALDLHTDLTDPDHPLTHDQITDDQAVLVTFWQQIQRARADAVVRGVALVQRAALGGQVKSETTRRYRDPVDSSRVVTETETQYTQADWRASAWLLERTEAAAFGRRPAQVEVSGAGGGPVQVEDGLAAVALRMQEMLARRQVVDGRVIEGSAQPGELEG